MPKFKEGDHVVGNSKALKYVLTKPGTKWIVIEVQDRHIQVARPSNISERYWVVSDCFDPAVPPPIFDPKKPATTRHGRKVTLVKTCQDGYEGSVRMGRATRTLHWGADGRWCPQAPDWDLTNEA